MRKKDLTGRRFGRLTVLREAQQEGRSHRYWICRCDCGREVAVEGSHLMSGHTKSCGCYRRELPKERRTDITGCRFGRLVALEPVEVDKKEVGWKCRCDCGNTVVCLKDNLVGGNTRSCGCLSVEIRKENMKKAIHFVDGTCVERIASRRTCANNTSGHRGVYKRENNKWRAAIGFQGKVYNLGTFADYEDAVKARIDAEKNLYDVFLEKFSRDENSFQEKKRKRE